MKDILFTERLAPLFLQLITESPRHYDALNAILKDFEPKDWNLHKQSLLIHINRKQLIDVHKINIDYDQLAPLMDRQLWGILLGQKNGVTYVQPHVFNSFEPHLLEFIKTDVETYFQYLAVKKMSERDLLKFFAKKPVEITDNLIVPFLSSIAHLPFESRVRLVESQGVNPLYSVAAFQHFVYTVDRYDTLTLPPLPTEAAEWLVETIDKLGHAERKAFFDNKFQLKIKRVALYKDILRTKEFNSALSQDYSYLITFCNFILNPQSNLNIGSLAVVLDDYLQQEMRDPGPWWVKVQQVIDKISLRNHLNHSNRNSWTAIYEKIRMEKTLADAPKARRSNKL